MNTGPICIYIVLLTAQLYTLNRKILLVNKFRANSICLQNNDYRQVFEDA